jgi:transcriptional regulator with XRE-family HTH domain
MRNSVLESLGKHLRALRIERRLSQEELADRAGLHRTYVGGIERGERNVSLLNIVSIAAALGVTVSDLVSEVCVPQAEKDGSQSTRKQRRR